MRRGLMRLIGVVAISGALGITGFALPRSAAADENCVAWSQEYGCEATIACIILIETHGYCRVYWTAGPNAGGFEMLFFSLPRRRC